MCAVSWDGRVAPCLSLLHSHTEYINSQARRVSEFVVGQIDERRCPRSGATRCSASFASASAPSTSRRASTAADVRSPRRTTRTATTTRRPSVASARGLRESCYVRDDRPQPQPPVAPVSAVRYAGPGRRRLVVWVSAVRGSPALRRLGHLRAGRPEPRVPPRARRSSSSSSRRRRC